jgi:hypothetical protein
MKKTKTIHGRKWFWGRIGKRIFRDDNKCGCLGCAKVLEKGLVILNEQHAEHLYLTQFEFANEGVFCNYRDKK